MKLPSVSSVLLAASLACATACGIDARGTMRAPPATDTSETSPKGGGSASASAGASDTIPIDAGASSAPSVFDGAPAYVATTGPSTNDDEHPSDGDPAGRACLSCHDGSGKPPAFVMGGTVYVDGEGTAPLANAEVRLVAGTDVWTAYTNHDGNFFVRGSATIAAGHAGVRNSSNARDMPSNASGDCNACHDGSTTPRIHLP